MPKNTPNIWRKYHEIYKTREFGKKKNSQMQYNKFKTEKSDKPLSLSFLTFPVHGQKYKKMYTYIYVLYTTAIQQL